MKRKRKDDDNNVVDMSDVDAILRRPSIYDDNTIAELAKLNGLAYARRREQEAKNLGIGVGQLDKAVREQRKQSASDNATLPHCQFEPWSDEVLGTELLAAITAQFKRFIVLPAGAGDALALWVLHAWTFDAGDVSPFWCWSRRRSGAARRAF